MKKWNWYFGGIGGTSCRSLAGNDADCTPRHKTETVMAETEAEARQIILAGGSDRLARAQMSGLWVVEKIDTKVRAPQCCANP